MSLSRALLPLGTMIGCFVVGRATLDLGSELLVMSMLIAATVAGLQAVKVGASWESIQRSAGEKLAAVLPAILILLAIGMLIGTWVLSGTIPALIVLGLQLINPQLIVLTAFLVTAAMSLCTGTSWGSAGTVGVALMGVAVAMEAPLAATAGAVVSGAYFGDKLSPLSDSTNICAIGANANLYSHIHNMLFTAVPSFVAAALVFGFVGGADFESSAADNSGLATELGSLFHLSVWVLLPMLVVVVGTVRRIPPVLTLASSSVIAMSLGVLLQGFRLEDSIVAAVSGFDSTMVSSLAVDPSTLSPELERLLNRGGLSSMVDTLLIILTAFLLAAGLDVSGALDQIVESMVRRARSTFRLVAATMASGVILISVTSHGGVTALIVGGLFQKAYRDRGLAPENLSRSMEDSVTIVEPLLPWTVSAVFMATTLGVPTIEYLPWAVFCYGGPIFSLLWAATGLRRQA